jgi:hypothetical protein
MNYAKYCQIYCLISFLFFSVYVFGQEEKDKYLKLDKDGIKVYIYSHKNSDFGTFKAVTYINASLDSVLAVLLDNKSCTEWIHACDKSFIIEDVSFNERYHYQILDIPFPFEDRDFIFHSIMKQNPSTKAITITSTAVSGYCSDKQSSQCKEANQPDLVRVSKSTGTFKLETDDKGIKVTWIQHTDPAGNLPGWLVNQFLVDTPYWTLRKLAQKVTEEKYQDAKLIYDIEGIAVALNMPKHKQRESSKLAKDLGPYPTF